MTTSPLGRYAEVAPDQPLRPVELLNLPVRPLADGQDRHDSLMRELALPSFSEDDGRPQPPGSWS